MVCENESDLTRLKHQGYLVPLIYLVDSPRVRGEDVKGARWMPWHRKPKKDAASCDNPRGGANAL